MSIALVRSEDENDEEDEAEEEAGEEVEAEAVEEEEVEGGLGLYLDRIMEQILKNQKYCIAAIGCRAKRARPRVEPCKYNVRAMYVRCTCDMYRHMVTVMI